MSSWRRLGSISLSTSMRNIFSKALRRSSKMLQTVRFVVLLLFWWMKIENRDLAIDT